jgi:hypothetical protein
VEILTDAWKFYHRMGRSNKVEILAKYIEIIKKGS